MTLDCLVIGYNDPPFEAYERLIRQYGRDSEAYRDLQFSFVEVDGVAKTYIELLNFVRKLPESLYSGAIPNLAAAYLTSFLRKRGFIADYINLFQQEKDRLAALLAKNPRCVAITTTFYVIDVPVIEIIQFIREYNPSVKIIVGGPLVANSARKYGREHADSGMAHFAANAEPTKINQEFEAALSGMAADIYVIEGQGEFTLARIVDRLRRGATVTDVPNIVFAEGGGYYRTPTEPENNDLDTVDIDWGSLSPAALGHTIQMRTARSCAFKCSFCNYPARAGKLTLAGLDTIKRELDSIRNRGDVANVVFIDDTFNVPLERFKEICQLMIRERYGFNWYSYFRCSNSDEEAFDLMAESGCKGVFLGIESGSPLILKYMNKAATVEKYERGIGQLRQRDILSFASFIVGFPGETDATVRETVEFLRATKPDFYRAQLWYCEPGTPIDGRKTEFDINGEGFVWTHATMDSLSAMDHIERMFLTTQDSLWLPQWSFDFWIIPYLRGEGVTRTQFSAFMKQANKLLALQIASVEAEQKRLQKKRCLETLTELFSEHEAIPATAHR
jgi:radical SAM PhpK family P-methyltransferase